MEPRANTPLDQPKPPLSDSEQRKSRPEHSTGRAAPRGFRLMSGPNLTPQQRYYLENRERRLKESHEYKIKNSEKVRAAGKRYREKHPNLGRARYWANREHALERSRTYRDAKRQYLSEGELAKCRADIRRAKTIRGDDFIACLECGQLVSSLNHAHLREHDTNRTQYKLKWGYNSGTGLASEKYSKHQSTAVKRRGLPEALRKNRFGRGRRHTIHTGWQRRTEGNLNYSDGKSGIPQPWSRKVFPGGRTVSDFEIAELRLAGKAISQIAQHTGLSDRAILARLRRLHFPSGHPCKFEHGAPITGQAIIDHCDAFGITRIQLAELIGVVPETIYHHTRRGRNRVLPISLVSAIQGQRRALRGRRASTIRGGRPSALLPADRQALPAKYQTLSSELKLLRNWLSDQDSRPPLARVQEWICNQSRSGEIRTLLFWPEFFRWVKKMFSTKGFSDATWKPHELAREFLAEDYAVSLRTIESTVFGSQAAKNTQ